MSSDFIELSNNWILLLQEATSIHAYICVHGTESYFTFKQYFHFKALLQQKSDTAGISSGLLQNTNVSQKQKKLKY